MGRVAIERETPPTASRTPQFSTLFYTFSTSTATNGYLRIWDTATLRLKHTLGHSQGVYCLASSKDSGLLAVGGGDGQVRLWDMSGDAPKEKEKGLL